MDRLPSRARGERFDHAVQQLLLRAGRACSVREVRQALKEGHILINGQKRSPGDRARGEEDVNLEALSLRSETRAQPQAALLDSVGVIFRSETLLVLDKPSGLATVPIRADETNTLLNAAVVLAPEVAVAGPPIEGGAVHRLDTATSGLVMFACSEEERQRLRLAFTEHQVVKEYWACVEDCHQSLLDQELRQEIVPVGVGQSATVAEGSFGKGLAISQLKVWGHQQGRAWVSVRTRYGRRHQVRVQLASLGTPIVGDAVYGTEDSRLALHASHLELPDGRSFEAPIPPDLRELLGGWAP